MLTSDKDTLYDEIRKEIADKGLSSDIPELKEVFGICAVSESSFSPENYASLVSDMDNTCVIRPSVPLKGNPIVVFIKKVIRKLTRFYVEPAFNSQTEFNGNAVRTARMLGIYFAENGTLTPKDMAGKLEIMDMKLKSFAENTERLAERVALLEEENVRLRLALSGGVGAENVSIGGTGAENVSVVGVATGNAPANGADVGTSAADAGTDAGTCAGADENIERSGDAK